MKKIISVMLICVLLSCVSSVNVLAADTKSLSDGEVWLNDDFELELDGATQSGYTVYRNSNISSVKTVDGNSVILSKNSESATANSMHFDKNFGILFEGTLIMECKVKFNSNSASAKVLSLKDEDNTWRDTVTFSSDGKIKLCGTEVGSYAANQWYHIILLFNTSAKEVRGQITGESTNINETKAYNLPNLKAARFELDFSDGGFECLIDDIRIYGGTEILNEFPQREYNKNISAIDNSTIEAKLKNAVAYVEGEGYGFIFGEKVQISAPCIINNGKFFVPCEELESRFSVQAETDATINGIAYADSKKFAADNGYGLFEDARGLAVISPASISYDEKLAGKIISTIIFSRPDGSSVASSLSSTRPRICVDSTQIALLKALYNTDAKVKSDIDRLLLTADGYLSSTPVGYNDTDIRTVSQRIRTRVGILGLAYLYTNENKYAKRLWEEAENFCGFEDWFNTDSLSHAEMLFAAAMAYDWLYDYLEAQPEDKAALKSTIIEKGLSIEEKVFNATAYGLTTWASASDNIAAVCSSGALAAALSVAEPNEENTTILKSLEFPLKACEGFLENFAPDGGYYEGFTYASYALRNFAPAMASLKYSCGTDYGLLKTPALCAAADFYIYITGAGGIFNFHDAEYKYRRSGCEIYWLANEYKKPYLGYWAMKSEADGNLDFSYSDMFFYKGGYDNKNLIPDKLFKGAEVGAFKGDDTYVGMHAGKVGVTHGEFDAGSFVYDAMGERFVTDLGPDSYSLSEYNTVRDDFPYYRRRAEGHNTLVINPDESAGQSTQGETFFTNFESTVGYGSAALNLTSAYENYGAESVIRKFDFDRTNQILEITDTIICNEASEIYSFIHTEADVNLAEDGKSAELTVNGKTVTVELLTPYDAVLGVMDAAPLSTSLNPDGQNANTGVKKLFVHIENCIDAEIKLRLSPNGTAYDNADKLKASWFLRQNEKTLDYEYASELSSGKYMLEIDVPEAQENQLMAVIALYDDNELISVNMEHINSTDAGTQVSLSINADLKKSGQYKIRALVWDGVSLSPVAISLPEPLTNNIAK